MTRVPSHGPSGLSQAGCAVWPRDRECHFSGRDSTRLCPPPANLSLLRPPRQSPVFPPYQPLMSWSNAPEMASSRLSFSLHALGLVGTYALQSLLSERIMKGAYGTRSCFPVRVSSC